VDRARRQVQASAPVLMVGAAFAFTLMGVCVKFASTRYGAGEIVFYRSLVGLALMALVMGWRGIGRATRVPGMHLWRSLSGTVARLHDRRSAPGATPTEA